MLVNPKDLDDYIKDRNNVLFEGPHGVGKTAMVKATFERAKFKWLYFSASTMDPWVDLVGVPKPRKLENGQEVLDLVRPAWVLNDEVDAIFFDELNRAPEKVLNAVMELIQFKSINGLKLNRLKVVWGAINPHDEEATYHVTKLDPAQRDRFHRIIQVPYKVDREYFERQHGDIAEQFIYWWNMMPDSVQREVSPRRLDYAAEAYKKGRSLETVLPHQANIAALREALNSAPFVKKLNAAQTDAEVRAFLKNSNNMTTLLDMANAGNADAVQFVKKHRELMPAELVEALAPTPAEKSKKKDAGLAALKGAVGKFGPAGDEVNNELLARHFVPEDLFAVESLRADFSLHDELKRLITEMKMAKPENYTALCTHFITYLGKAPVEKLAALPPAIIDTVLASAALEREHGGSIFTATRVGYIRNKLAKAADPKLQGLGAAL